MAFTVEQLNKLEEAIAQGAREVWYGDKRIQYNSLKEMKEIRDLMKAELGLSNNKTTKVVAVFNKGL